MISSALHTWCQNEKQPQLSASFPGQSCPMATLIHTHPCLSRAQTSLSCVYGQSESPSPQEANMPTSQTVYPPSLPQSPSNSSKCAHPPPHYHTQTNLGCHTGEVNPHRLQVGYRQVWVRVDILLPLQNPYPARGLWWVLVNPGIHRLSELT
jgi:hypothetical protein